MTNTDECSICREEFNNTNRMQSVLPCNHILCRSCMLDIFKTSYNCPFCRKTFKMIIQHKNEPNNKTDSNINVLIKDLFEENMLLISNSNIYILLLF